MDPAADVRAARELWRILQREQVDVLHTHNPKPGLYGRVVGRLARVPVVVNTVHGLYATDDDPISRRAAVYSLEAFAARFSDAELIQNPEDLELMRRWHLTRNAELLGNGVDLTRFDPARFSTDERHAVRAALGIDDDTVLVGTVGRLVAEKGLPELFAAMTRLPRDRFVLVVVGAPDPIKPDALGADEVARCTRTRGSVPRSSRRRRRARTRPWISSCWRRTVKASPRGDGGERDGTSGRRHRRPRVPGGRRGRRHWIAGAGRRRRRAGGGAPGAPGAGRGDAPSATPPAREPGSTSTSAGSSRSCWPRTRRVARQKGLALPGL